MTPVRVRTILATLSANGSSDSIYRDRSSGERHWWAPWDSNPACSGQTAFLLASSELSRLIGPVSCRRQAASARPPGGSWVSAPECFPRAAASARFPLLRLFSGQPPPWPCSQRHSPSEVIQGLLTRLFKQSPLRRHATRWPPRAFGFWHFHIKVVERFSTTPGSSMHAMIRIAPQQAGQSRCRSRAKEKPPTFPTPSRKGAVESANVCNVNTLRP